MDRYHQTNPPTELKSAVMGRENSQKKKSVDEAEGGKDDELLAIGDKVTHRVSGRHAIVTRVHRRCVNKDHVLLLHCSLGGCVIKEIPVYDLSLDFNQEIYSVAGFLLKANDARETLPR